MEHNSVYAPILKNIEKYCYFKIISGYYDGLHDFEFATLPSRLCLHDFEFALDLILNSLEKLPKYRPNTKAKMTLCLGVINWYNRMDRAF